MNGDFETAIFGTAIGMAVILVGMWGLFQL